MQRAVNPWEFCKRLRLLSALVDVATRADLRSCRPFSGFEFRKSNGSAFSFSNFSCKAATGRQIAPIEVLKWPYWIVKHCIAVHSTDRVQWNGFAPLVLVHCSRHEFVKLRVHHGLQRCHAVLTCSSQVSSQRSGSA